ncbi:MAG: hypothetical protein ACRCXZ_05920 [Patescibacteria group bacterium]
MINNYLMIIIKCVIIELVKHKYPVNGEKLMKHSDIAKSILKANQDIFLDSAVIATLVADLECNEADKAKIASKMKSRMEEHNAPILAKKALEAKANRAEAIKARLKDRNCEVHLFNFDLKSVGFRDALNDYSRVSGGCSSDSLRQVAIEHHIRRLLPDGFDMRNLVEFFDEKPRRVINQEDVAFLDFLADELPRVVIENEFYSPKVIYPTDFNDYKSQMPKLNTLEFGIMIYTSPLGIVYFTIIEFQDFSILD